MAVQQQLAVPHNMGVALNVAVPQNGAVTHSMTVPQYWMIPALIIFDVVFNFSFIIKVIKPFPITFWLYSEYFEYNNGPIASQTKVHTGLKRKKITSFYGKTKMYVRDTFVCQLFFLFSFL